MGLVAPLFLIGAFAIALPIWLHRLQTESATRERFGSSMLLDPTEERVHVRRTLKYWWLLALRVGLLLLLALAFAQPYIKSAATLPTSLGTHVIVLDTSLSMSAPSVMDSAQGLAREVIQSIPQHYGIRLVDALAPHQNMTDANIDRTALEDRVATMTAGVDRLDFGQLMNALDDSLQSLEGAAVVHLISDFQESATPGRFADLVPQSVFDFTAYPVKYETRANWSIDYVRRADDQLVTGIRAYDTEPTNVSITLLVNGKRYSGAADITAVGEISVGGVEFEQGNNRIEARLDTDDALVADNRYFTVVDNRPPEPVPLLTTETDGRPQTYISAALGAAGNDYRIEPLIAGDYDLRVLSRYRWLIVDDLGRLDAQTADAVREFISDGGNVLAFVGEGGLAAKQLPVTATPIQSAVLAPRRGSFTPVARIDTTHPALQNADRWEDISIAQYVAVVPGPDDREIVTLESGEPLLFEQRIGAGKIVVLTSSLDNRWSDLPTRAVFVSFMIDVAAHLSGREQLQRLYTLGDTLPLSAANAGSGQVIDPEGNKMLTFGGTGRAQLISLDIPGFYEVYTSRGESLIAVNTDPRESDTNAMTASAIEQWQAAVSGGRLGAAQARAVEPDTDEVLTTSLWPWLMLILGLVVVAESVTANHYFGAGVRR